MYGEKNWTDDELVETPGGTRLPKVWLESLRTKIPTNTRVARPIFDLHTSKDMKAARVYLGLSQERLGELARVCSAIVAVIETTGSLLGARCECCRGHLPTELLGFVRSALHLQLRAVGL